MSLRDKNFVPREYFHIYNRGNNKQNIFLDKEDYEHFQKLLYICNTEFNFSFKSSVVEQKIDAFDYDRDIPLVNILSWVLMPNHFHLLISSDREDLWLEKHNPISEYMRKLSTAYVMYFNKKYNRSGTIFEGKFKSKHIGEENYFNYIFSYIHLNPIKLINKKWGKGGVGDETEILKFLGEYKHSSYLDFFDKKERRKEFKIINMEKIPDYLKNLKTKDLLLAFHTSHRSDLGK
jgi:putative transposase